MRVMVFAKATPQTESALPPTPEAFAAMDRFTEELVQAGILVAGAGLMPSTHAKRLLVAGEKRTVIDGPFTETKELIAGFAIWQVKDMAEALSWARRCPNPMSGPSQLEIWPFMEAEDLAGLVTPEELATPRDGERGRLGVV